MFVTVVVDLIVLPAIALNYMAVSQENLSLIIGFRHVLRAVRLFYFGFVELYRENNKIQGQKNRNRSHRGGAKHPKAHLPQQKHPIADVLHSRFVDFIMVMVMSTFKFMN